MADLTGTTLGKYQIVERRGRGGMATVYKAYHPRLARYVAVKVLHSHLAEGQDFLGRFEREARAVATLRHPHIAQAYDFDVEGEIYYLVMEFIDGQSLEEKLAELSKRGEQLPLAETAQIIHQVAEALDYAHQQGMLHRDLKPSNVLLDRQGQAFLVDFGIARMLSGTQYTSTGELLGTPAYMSPEQGLGKTLTSATDIYSLGVMLYEMVTGRVPFDADTPYGVIHKHINDPLPPPRQLRPDLPEALVQVLVTALAKDPGERYHSAGEMARALEWALAQKTPVKVDASARSGLPPTTASGSYATVKVEPLEESRLEQPAVAPAAAVPSKKEQSRPAEVVQKQPAEPSKRVAEKPIPMPATRRRGRLWPSLLAIAGLVAVGVVAVVFILPQPNRGLQCPGVQVCIERAVAAKSNGEFDKALSYFDIALGKLSPGPHPEFAFIWCERGDINRAKANGDIARTDYQHCLEWAQDAPEFEAVRVRANEGLRSLGP
jgi:serine/threonine protein kinase